MKSAEQWLAETLFSDTSSLDDVREIQLDAMKEGMRRAAGMDRLARHTNVSHEDVKQIAENILNVSERLTEKDL